MNATIFGAYVVNHDPIPIAKVGWALEAFGDAEQQIALQLLRRETPTLRLAYIARRRLVRGDALPDGSLAYDVTPFELPTRSVFVGVKALSRRERRRRARRGRRGRRWNGNGSMLVAAYEDRYTQETYEPAYWREFAPTECIPVPYPWDLDAIPTETLIYSRQPISVAIRICERCRCEIRLIVTLYIEREAPQLTQCILRGLQLASQRFGADVMHQERCFCNPTTHFHPLPGHASERLAP